jgi:hypothetical protein
MSVSFPASSSHAVRSLQQPRNDASGFPAWTSVNPITSQPEFRNLTTSEQLSEHIGGPPPAHHAPLSPVSKNSSANSSVITDALAALLADDVPLIVSPTAEFPALPSRFNVPDASITNAFGSSAASEARVSCIIPGLSSSARMPFFNSVPNLVTRMEPAESGAISAKSVDISQPQAAVQTSQGASHVHTVRTHNVPDSCTRTMQGAVISQQQPAILSTSSMVLDPTVHARSDDVHPLVSPSAAALLPVTATRVLGLASKVPTSKSLSATSNADRGPVADALQPVSLSRSLCSAGATAESIADRDRGPAASSTSVHRTVSDCFCKLGDCAPAAQCSLCDRVLRPANSTDAMPGGSCDLDRKHADRSSAPSVALEVSVMHHYRSTAITA